MPQAIKIGKKQSRVSPELAAQLSAGAVVAGAPTVEELEAAAAAAGEKPEKPGEQLNAGEGEGTGTGEGEGQGEGQGEGEGEGEGQGEGNPDLSARVTELETNVTALNTQLTTQKGINEHLQTQLNAANETLGATKAELNTAKEATTKANKNISAYRTVVMNAITNLSVAFSTQPPALDSMTDEQLCAQYTTMRERFDKAYVTGGKSQATDEVQNPPKNLLTADENPVASAAARVTTLPSRSSKR
jgi:hypothetical protein